MFVSNFKILSQVVSEKSLTEKKVYRQTDRQTNIHTEKAKTIYPLYTRAVPKVRGHDLIMLFLEYYSNKFFIL